MPSVSAHLKKIRLEAKYGQSRLAQRAGISASTYRRAENGQNVYWETIERIVDALSASLGRKLEISEILDEASAERFSRIGVEVPVFALNRIKKRISDIGLSLDELSKRANISKAVLSRVLKGGTQTTQRGIITRIAAALDFTMESLFEDQTEQDRDQKRLLEENLVVASKGRRLLAISDSIPEQSPIIRFGISTGAKINLIPTLVDENDFQIIEGLRAELLAEDGPVKYLTERYLSNPNIPQAGLFGPLISNYDKELSKDPKEVNYTVLYARGARFYAARRIADQQVASGEWPELSAREAEAIDAICDLHGPLIMASANGRRIVEDAHRYEVPPSVYERDRDTIDEFGKALAAETEIVEPEAAEAYRDLTAKVEGDQQPARSRGMGIAATGSALTVIVGGAVWYGAGGAVATFIAPAAAVGAAGLVGAFVWEAVKTMPRFKKATSKVGEQFEKALDQAEKLADPKERILLERMADLVRRKRSLFEKVAELRPEFGWVKKYLNGVQDSGSQRPLLVPKLDRHLCISGARGSGKTTTGKLLAKRLNVKFDTLSAGWDPTDAAVLDIVHVLNAPPHVIEVDGASFGNPVFWQNVSGKARFVWLENSGGSERHDRDLEIIKSNLSDSKRLLRIYTVEANQVEEVVERIVSQLLVDYLL